MKTYRSLLHGDKDEGRASLSLESARVQMPPFDYGQGQQCVTKSFSFTLYFGLRNGPVLLSGTKR